MSMAAQEILQDIDGLPLENMPYPRWMKQIIRFGQRGKLYLAVCVVLGILAFPFALVIFVTLVIWRFCIGHLRR